MYNVHVRHIRSKYKSVTSDTHLRPVVDSVRDGTHGERMAADEVATEVDLTQTVQLGVETGDLTDVVADRNQQALRHVTVAERRRCTFQKQVVNFRALIGCRIFQKHHDANVISEKHIMF